ncbi:ATP-binding cassette domain-containing protein [Agathobacter ruminis]|uniref:Multidrug ABC transporter ATP-binding protein n=1 Tax=Agathobacter ruminis TaxID=1712665 RepID=A0A2G3DZU5_9FIRM|nr:ATP-binding cassette domain-containing protein [Agathobacter ruminis]MDC7300689.1 ATP-binding cassette domain-containing protein [Agathobacter ruminis]PHU36415.1 multidrug ABC transporter ATP-binding protein [Agathobacter ruminis]
MILRADNLVKKIKGKTILDHISIEFESGKVYGIVGRNGSGKTMLFRALSGLMKCDEGAVYLDDQQLGKDFPVLPDLGIVIENAGLYPEYSGKKNLKLLSALKGKISDEEIEEAIRRVGLDPNDKRPVRKYSLGMKQRIVIAQAIMEHPMIFMLDEPTNAIDENGVKELRKLIEQERQRGAMVLLASHSKEDIELLADVVIHMNEGKIIS